MRAAAILTLLLAACGSATYPTGAASTSPATGAGNPDAGNPDAGNPDAGNPDAGNSDAGHSDAGNSDPGGAADAGTIVAAPCPASPELRWSRTFADEVDFRGAADADGFVYWVEYDPPPTAIHPDTQAFLVSADRDGNDRYRAPISVASKEGVFLLAAGKIVLSQRAVLAAYDAATGTAAWSLDLGATYTDGDAMVSGIADTGDGELAFGMYDYAVASGLYLADAATGAIKWSNVTSADASYSVAGSDGRGHALATGFPSSPLSPAYHTEADVFVIDGAGQQVWRHHLVDGPPEGGALLAWTSGGPWLGIGGAQTLSPSGDYVAAPPGWFSAVQGNDLAFALRWQDAATAPIAVDAIRGNAAIAEGSIAGTDSYDGISAFPFLAGEAGDHLILLSQNWHSIPALCHPSAAGAAALSRIDVSTSYQCPFAFAGESAIEGAALLEGRVVIGRRTYLSDACTQELQPVTIESYALPGESLAPAGWVQRRGSPGLGMRPR